MNFSLNIKVPTPTTLAWEFGILELWGETKADSKVSLGCLLGTIYIKLNEVLERLDGIGLSDNGKA